MRTFGYLRDPVFLSASLLYALNRWLFKPHFRALFLHNWFNDLLLIPCALPVLLWIYRRLKLRPSNAFPTLLEVCSILVFWSLLFEWIGPHLVNYTVGDWRDVIMYWTGGLLAWVCWFWYSRRPRHEF